MRDRQNLIVAALVGAAVLAIAGGYFVGVFLTRPPEASPTPTAVAVSPTPSPRPSPTPRPSPSPSPTPSPTPSPRPTSSPRPTAPPTPVRTRPPSAPPGVPALVTFRSVALDDPAVPEQERILGFSSDAPGPVRVAATGTSGGAIELCLTASLPDAPPGEPLCETGDSPTLTATAGAGETDWELTVAAVNNGQTPVTNLSLTFPASRPRVDLDGFRFQGVSEDGYDGFTADIPVRVAGELDIAASWTDDDGDSTHDYQLIVTDLTDPSRPPFTARGTDSSMSASAPVIGGHTYRVHLGNATETVPTRVVLDANVDWP
jgi:hypothetical protein